MFKPVCNLVGYQCQLARNRSAPNQWAQSAINVCMDTSNKCINAKSMGTISYQCPQGHTYKIDRCQTNCHTQLLMSTHTHTHKHATINGKPMDMILNLFIKTGNNYSLAVINRESLYELMYLRFICYKLKLIDVITIHTSLSISHD